MDPGKGTEKASGKSAHKPHHRGSAHNNNSNSNSNNIKRQNSGGTNDHTNKRLRPAAVSAEAASARRLEDIRLVLKSTPSDGDLAAKIDATKTELRAVERALAQEGTYLGIVDAEELEKRKYVLEKRFNLLQEEKSLLRSLRAQLAEEGEGGTVAEQAESRPPSSPPPRRTGNKHHNNGDNTTAHPSSPSLRVSLSASPSVGSPSAGSPAAPRRPIYQLSPPKTTTKGGGDGGIGDFLKKNSEAVGKKLAAGAGR